MQDRENLALHRCTIRLLYPEYCAKFIMWDVVTQEQVAVGSLRIAH